MNGWSAVGGQTISAYVEGGVEREDGVMGHSVRKYFVQIWPQS